MSNEPRAKELALEGAVVVFFVTALLGLLTGTAHHVAALRGLAAGALVAFAGPFPLRILLDAIEHPEPPAAHAEEPQAADQAAPATRDERAA